MYALATSGAAAAGYRLQPVALSPYLRWRIETYWGLHADDISPAQFRAFLWSHRGRTFSLHPMGPPHG